MPLSIQKKFIGKLSKSIEEKKTTPQRFRPRPGPYTRTLGVSQSSSGPIAGPPSPSSSGGPSRSDNQAMGPPAPPGYTGNPVPPFPPHLSGRQQSQIDTRNNMLRSYDFMSKNRIYERVTPNTKDPNFFKDMVSGNPKAFNKEYVSFSELKATNPALFMEQDKRTGYWQPKLNTERWAKELENNSNPVAVGVARFSWGVTQAFNPDFYINAGSGNIEKMYSESLYNTKQASSSGDFGRIATNWAGLQAPAYENVIFPLAGGYVFGKLSTGMKLAGGFGKASNPLKAGYVGMTGLGVGFGAKTGVDIYNDINTGNIRGLGRDVFSLGSSLLLGGVGFKSGSASAMRSFEADFPNVAWGSKGIPTSEKLINFSDSKMSVTGGKVTNNTQRSFYSISQVFKPGKESTTWISFPKNVTTKPYWLSVGSLSTELRGPKIVSRTGPRQQYIDFPGSPSSFKPRFDMDLFKSGGDVVGIVEGSSKPYRTMFGKRAISYKGIMGRSEKSYIGTFEGGKAPAGFEDMSMIRIQGGNIRTSDMAVLKEPNTMNKAWVNRNKSWISSNNAAEMSLMPRIEYLTRPKMNTSFESPLIKNLGGSSLNYPYGSGFHYRSEVGVSDIYAPAFLSNFKRGINPSNIHRFSFGHRSSINNAFGTNLDMGQISFNINSSILGPRIKLSQPSISDKVLKQDYKQDFKYNFENRTNYFYLIPDLYRFHLSGHGGGYDFSRQMNASYLFRQFKLPNLDKIFKKAKL